MLEKILEEIEEEKLKHWDPSERLDTDKLIGWCFEKCKAIIRKHMNDGWIPVEEQLPENCAENPGRQTDHIYPVTVDLYGEIDVRYYTFFSGNWYDENCRKMNEHVTAWQPRSEPYHPEKAREEST